MTDIRTVRLSPSYIVSLAQALPALHLTGLHGSLQLLRNLLQIIMTGGEDPVRSIEPIGVGVEKSVI